MKVSVFTDAIVYVVF